MNRLDRKERFVCNVAEELVAMRDIEIAQENELILLKKMVIMMRLIRRRRN